MVLEVPVLAAPGVRLTLLQPQVFVVVGQVLPFMVLDEQDLLRQGLAAGGRRLSQVLTGRASEHPQGDQQLKMIIQQLEALQEHVVFHNQLQCSERSHYFHFLSCT